VLGWPVAFPHVCSYFRDALRVGRPLVMLSVWLWVGFGRWSDRVVVITYVVWSASIPITDPESRWNMVYGSPSYARSSMKNIWTTLVSAVWVELAAVSVLVSLASWARVKVSDPRISASNPSSRAKEIEKRGLIMVDMPARLLRDAGLNKRLWCWMKRLQLQCCTEIRYPIAPICSQGDGTNKSSKEESIVNGKD